MNTEEFEKLTSSQKAVIALEVEERLAEEAHIRRLAGLKQNQAADSLRKELPNGGEMPLGNYLPNDNAVPLGNRFIRDKAAVQAATITGTNKQYVKDAKKIQRQAPELLESVRNGLLTIPQAKKVAAMPDAFRKREL